MLGRVKAWAETDEEERELWDLAQKAFTKLGHPLKVAGTYIPGTVLKPFLSEANLISPKPISFVPLTVLDDGRKINRGHAIGYPAEILPQICDVSPPRKLASLCTSNIMPVMPGASVCD